MITFRTNLTLGLVGLLSTTAPLLHAEDIQAQLEALDQKQRILERKWELAEEAQAAKVKTTPVVKADSSGFSIAAPDKSFELKLRALVQTDARFFFGDDDKPQADTFLLRRVRPTLEGKLGEKGEFRITPEFAGSSSTLLDAYGGYEFSSALRLRIGKFKSPFGLERLQSGADIRFIERAHPTSLAPNRDVGVQLSGDLIGGTVSYAIGGFNGVADGGSSVSDSDDGKDAVGRLFFSPFKNSDVVAVKGLGFGVAASYGDEQGTASSSGLASYRSPGQASVFSYRSSTNDADNVIADGHRTRYSPQATWYAGPVGILGEYVVSSHEVTRGEQSDTLDHEAWQVAASVVLTGEDNSFRGIQPKKPFDPAKKQWGAFELVARYSELNLDEQTFPTYADASKSVESIQSTAIGLNWYLTRNLQSSLTYETSRFDGGASDDADREDENVLFARFQVNF